MPNVSEGNKTPQWPHMIVYLKLTHVLELKLVPRNWVKVWYNGRESENKREGEQEGRKEVWMTKCSSDQMKQKQFGL